MAEHLYSGVIHTAYYHAKVVFHVKTRKGVNLLERGSTANSDVLEIPCTYTYTIQDLFVLRFVCLEDSITVPWLKVVNIVLRWSRRGPCRSICLPLCRGMCTCTILTQSKRAISASRTCTHSYSSWRLKIVKQMWRVLSSSSFSESARLLCLEHLHGIQQKACIPKGSGFKYFALIVWPVIKDI